MTRHIYEIRVIGSFGPATSEAFADMAVEVEPTRDADLVRRLSSHGHATGRISVGLAAELTAGDAVQARCHNELPQVKTAWLPPSILATGTPDGVIRTG